MNAVNLIPREGRSGGAGVSVSPLTLALIGGLILALIAAVVYVTAANTVATRKSELAQVSARVAASFSLDAMVDGVLAGYRTELASKSPAGRR